MRNSPAIIMSYLFRMYACILNCLSHKEKEWANITGAWWLPPPLKVHRVEGMKWLVINILYKEVALYYKDNITATAATAASEGGTGNPHQTFEANKLNQL